MCLCAHMNVSKCLHVHERVHIPRALQAGMCHLFVLSVLMWAWPARRGAVTDQQTNPCHPVHLLSPPSPHHSPPSLKHRDYISFTVQASPLAYGFLIEFQVWTCPSLVLGPRSITAPADAWWAAAGGQRGSVVYNRPLTLIAESHRVTAALTCGTYNRTYMVGIG